MWSSVQKGNAYKNKISFKSERKILNEDVIFNLEVCKKQALLKSFQNIYIIMYLEEDH